MKGTRFNEEQIIGVLREQEGGRAGRKRCAGVTGSRGNLLQVEVEVRRPGGSDARTAQGAGG